jgi:ribosomal protein L7/L12
VVVKLLLKKFKQFTVVLKEAGASISCCKMVKELTGLGLKVKM